MSMTNWKRILRQLQLTGDGGPYPVTEEELASFEKRTGRRLSNSYRSYCRVFGPGRLADTFIIAVPGYEGSVDFFSVEKLTDAVVNHTGYKEYAPASVRPVIERGLFFGSDEAKGFYFFDPEDVPYRQPYECAVYAVARDYEVTRLTDSFWEFVHQYCLGKQYTKLFPGSAPALEFFPCSV